MNRRIANKLKKMAGVREVTVQEAWEKVAAHLVEKHPHDVMFFVDADTNFRTSGKKLTLYTNKVKDILKSEEVPYKYMTNDIPWHYTEADEDFDEEEEEEETFLCHRCEENESTYEGEMCNECQELQDAEDMKVSKEQEKEYWDSKL